MEISGFFRDEFKFFFGCVGVIFCKKLIGKTLFIDYIDNVGTGFIFAKVCAAKGIVCAVFIKLSVFKIEPVFFGCGFFGFCKFLFFIIIIGSELCGKIDPALILKVREHSGNGGFVNLAVFNSENISKTVIIIFRKEEGGSVNNNKFRVLPFSAFVKFCGIVFIYIPDNAFKIFRSGFSAKSKSLKSSVAVKIVELEPDCLAFAVFAEFVTDDLFGVDAFKFAAYINFSDKVIKKSFIAFFPAAGTSGKTKHHKNCRQY